jgi:hypothetical protein
MPRTCKTPPVGGGASRDCCGGRSHSLLNLSDVRAQMLAVRFRLSPWMAHDLAEHFYGSGRP